MAHATEIRERAEIKGGELLREMKDAVCRAAPRCQKKSQAMIDPADLIRKCGGLIPGAPSGQSVSNAYRIRLRSKCASRRGPGPGWPRGLAATDGEQLYRGAPRRAHTARDARATRPAEFVKSGWSGALDELHLAAIMQNLETPTKSSHDERVNAQVKRKMGAGFKRLGQVELTLREM